MTALREAVARGFELADLAERELRNKAGWEILSPAQMGVVCFRFGREDEFPGRIVEAMPRGVYPFLTSAQIKQVICLRLRTINPRTTDQDVLETVRHLDECPRRVRRRPHLE